MKSSGVRELVGQCYRNLQKAGLSIAGKENGSVRFSISRTIGMFLPTLFARQGSACNGAIWMPENFESLKIF